MGALLKKAVFDIKSGLFFVSKREIGSFAALLQLNRTAGIQSIKRKMGGGQFDPESGGHFGPEYPGHFKSESGGQFERNLHSFTWGDLSIGFMVK